MAQTNGDSPILSQHLLLSVAEELKTPLLQIARRAEHGQVTGTPDLRTIQATADNALRLLDGYALGVRLALDQERLATEPVSVSSLLYDAGQQLSSLAKSYGVDLQLSIAGRYEPVMAHRQGLQSALVSLGAALIEALPALEGPQLKLHLATHRSRYGIVAGVYADTKQISAKALEQGRLLHPNSRQPLLGVTHTSGAGIFVADALLKAMNLNLKASRHQGLYGLGTVLTPNPQLQLV